MREYLTTAIHETDSVDSNTSDSSSGMFSLDDVSGLENNE